MKKIINAVYFNKYTFFISAAAACIGWIFFLAGNILLGNLFDAAIGAGPVSLAYLSLIILLVVSYKNGETNVQKTVLGALLAVMLCDYVDWIVFCFYAGFRIGFVYFLFFGILMTVLFVLHMLQQMDHAGHSKSVHISQYCGVLLILMLAGVAFLTILGQIRFESFVWSLSVTATVFLILIIEVRIDEYKKIRASKKAEGCWTDEERQKAKQIFAL